MFTKNALIKLLSGILSALLVTTGVSTATNNGNISTQQIEGIVAEAIDNTPEINSMLTSDESSASEETKTEQNTEAERIQEAMRVANEDATTGTTETNKPAVENKAVTDANASNKQDVVSKESQPAKATQSTQSVAKGASAPSTTYTAPATRGSVDLTAAAREAFVQMSSKILHC